MTDSHTVTARFNQTAGLLFKGHLVLNRRRILLVGIMYLGATAVWFLASRDSDWFHLMLGLSVVIWLLYLHAYLLHPWLYYRAMVNEPNMAGECEVEADDDSFRARNGEVESRFEWSCFTRLIERPDMLVLRVGKKQMIVVPKTSFGSEDDIAHFRGILSRRVQEPHRGKSGG